jgi:anion-transporting  ArsA/GET3 family ATPase
MLAEHLRTAPRIYSHLRTSGDQKESVMGMIRSWQRLAGDCMQFLREDVRLSLVTIPEALAVRQLDDVLDELRRHGLAVRRLIVNNVVQVTDSPFLVRKAAQQRPHLAELHERHGDLSIVEIPLFPEEVRGVERLRTVGRLLGPGAP